MMDIHISIKYKNNAYFLWYSFSISFNHKYSSLNIIISIGDIINLKYLIVPMKQKCSSNISVSWEQDTRKVIIKPRLLLFRIPLQKDLFKKSVIFLFFCASYISTFIYKHPLSCSLQFLSAPKFTVLLTL